MTGHVSTSTLRGHSARPHRPAAMLMRGHPFSKRSCLNGLFSQFHTLTDQARHSRWGLESPGGSLDLPRLPPDAPPAGLSWLPPLPLHPHRLLYAHGRTRLSTPHTLSPPCCHQPSLSSSLLWTLSALSMGPLPSALSLLCLVNSCTSQPLGCCLSLVPGTIPGMSLALYEKVFSPCPRTACTQKEKQTCQ